MKRSLAFHLSKGVLLASALSLLSGCNESSAVSEGATSSSPGSVRSATRFLPTGTRIEITLGGALSSETAHVGDSWRGTVTRDVVTRAGRGIPAGSRVDGEVARVIEARRGSRAMLQLDLTSIRVGNSEQRVAASAEAVVAGSTRKRNLGVVAGGAVAGALIGKSVGDGRNGIAGGLVGGTAATGVVATTKGFQVVLAEGTVMNFTANQGLDMH